MKFNILNRENVYQGKAFDVQKVHMQLPTGKHKYYDLVEHADSVSILPIDAEGNILFVSQYRLGADQELLELPAGLIDEGEDPLSAAQREIREETGYACKNMRLLGDFYLAAGYSSEHMFAYLAPELELSYLEPDTDEFITVKKIAIKEAINMVQAGDIQDAKTIATFMLALPHLVK